MSTAEFYALPERDWWIEWDRIKRERHDACGHKRSVCSDPNVLFYPQRTTCYATREKEAALAKWQALHANAPWHNGTESSWSKVQDEGHPYRYDMGVTLWVATRDVNPDDQFLSLESGRSDSLASVGDDVEGMEPPGVGVEER